MSQSDPTSLADHLKRHEILKSARYHLPALCTKDKKPNAPRIINDYYYKIASLMEKGVVASDDIRHKKYME
ncbi:hypothetical protein X777_09222 [Ooceraea biroi]|uniref:Uncharacterized protein n=1 Tax=Ooceraea biroi TaxID=2015173 RepID=A0A026W724_OOCBI|nr:hypothetical protein X777_09222 [Ooceraea biroi]